MHDLIFSKKPELAYQMEKDFVTKCRSMFRNVGKVKPEVKSTMPPCLKASMENRQKIEDCASQGHE